MGRKKRERGRKKEEERREGKSLTQRARGRSTEGTKAWGSKGVRVEQAVFGLS
jgi:hypothetical protein